MRLQPEPGKKSRTSGLGRHRGPAAAEIEGCCGRAQRGRDPSIHTGSLRVASNVTRSLPTLAATWVVTLTDVLGRQRQISKARQTAIGSDSVSIPRYLAVLSIFTWPNSARTVCKSPVPFRI